MGELVSMLMIFEDSDRSGFVSMIRAYYLNSGIHVLGANGNGNIINVYNRNRNLGKTLIYLDVIPNNAKTISLYNNLKKYFRNNDSVLVIPIVCSEELILRSFTSYRTDVWSDIINSNFSSVEKYYKDVIVKIAKCLDESSDYECNYYTHDCKCDCSVNSVIKKTYNIKQAMLVFNLPLRLVRADDIDAIPISIGCDILKSIEERFNTNMRDYLKNIGIDYANRNMYFISGRVQSMSDV